MTAIKKSDLDQVEKVIREMGHFAVSKQKGIRTRAKEDGSPVTEVDIGISNRLLSLLSTLFPEANLISEESPSVFNPEAPYSFILDPIDGTDVFSQGLPCFAIALGILDSDRRPVGAMIEAPRFGIGEEELFLRLDPGCGLLINGEKATVEQKDEIRQVTMSSKGQRLMDFSAFNGKVRTFGSTILHLVAPLVCSGIAASISAPCYVWDFAAAHAVLLASGYDIKYTNLTPLIYDDDLLKDRKMLKGFLYSGTEKGIETLSRVLPVRRA
jgi:Archaeal fructose-1,6-bisphosphatase and related enzymes of inositol monophosphatase family